MGNLSLLTQIKLKIWGTLLLTNLKKRNSPPSLFSNANCFIVYDGQCEALKNYIVDKFLKMLTI